jgi:hypothetical protein
VDSSDPVRASLHVSSVPNIDSWNNRYDPDPVLHEHMVETKQLLDAGEKSGAIKGDAVMVGAPQGWRLVAAPPQVDDICYSLIFWEAQDDDRTPSVAKVVRDLCRALALTK